ncbi:short chain dehydrogenase [Hirsutella rhossiliensis]|uniref:Short chain dehydrogenase domain-containing protein n=1 Tax=Hirsutella rhossiliensis TaxID=111463 RepID=A0A9P8N7V7_9HYPO|nr:short chain dehydrogenase domain-containing protein [Hirsutella rhossiliensis]KAH0966237.1 short chain dehydrogenase domain-containing protein [Hirsutella rhossiliensis]
MADNWTYLITGSNRGIGKQMVADLLIRPATTVVATVRNPSASTSQSLKALPTAAGSRLAILAVDEDTPEIGYSSIPKRAAEAGIDRVDVAVANAGASGSFDWVLETDPEEVRRCFEVNSIGPFKLFQACWPLLDRSDPALGPGGKKFVLVTSFVGSIAGLEAESFPSAAYGMSKAGANWMAKKMSVEFKDRGLKVGIIHPGWVRTDMGQSLADAVGLEQPPMTIEDSSRLVLEQIDKLSFDTTHGKFINFDGQELPW